MTITDHFNQEIGHPRPKYQADQLQERVLQLEAIVTQLLEIHGLALIPVATTTGNQLKVVNLTPQ